MSDKEVRYGIANTALWAAATTNASNGSVNGGHDALTAYGGAVPLVNMFTGEVIFGGVGSGLYGMFFYIVIAVFVAGLMVGRTPGWLGQEDRGARDQVRRRRGALRADDGARADRARGRRRTSGSRRSSTRARTASPSRSTPTTRSQQQRQRVRRLRRDELLGRVRHVALYLGRWVPLIAALALGGSLAQKKIVPASAGTFRTDGADVRRAAGRRDRPHRRPDDLPGAHARADRRRAHAVMPRCSSARAIAVVVLTRRLRLRLPAAS